MRGLYVLRCSSGFAPTVYDDSAPTPRQIIDPTQCKRGDFGRTHLSLVGNNDRQKPGIYVNGLMFQRCGFGEPLVTGPSARSEERRVGSACVSTCSPRGWR